MGELTKVSDIAAPIKKMRALQKRVVDAAAAIRADPDAVEKAFMARQLILCTLPYRDPGDVPRWVRVTGNGALVIHPGWSGKEDKSFGYPYGTIPRLLLFWIVTEALRTKSRRLLLGRSLDQFAREIGLNPATGGGKRGDTTRLKEQMERLFRCGISFEKGALFQDVAVASAGELWWTNPRDETLFQSWIELGEKFYADILAAPVPLDLRALRALKRSPLALDLYALLAFRAYRIVTQNLKPQFLSWEQLRRQLGSEAADLKDFKKKIVPALRKIAFLYPGGLTIGMVRGGFTIHASRLAVPAAVTFDSGAKVFHGETDPPIR